MITAHRQAMGSKANQPAHFEKTQAANGQKPAAPTIGDSPQLLQRSLGNQAMRRYLQAKLTVNQPGDIYEQEAERVAEQVMRAAEPRVQIDTPKESDAVQAKSSAPSVSVPPDLEDRLQASQGNGQTLPLQTRRSMESHFGADFNDVRIHTGYEAAELNRQLSALAFTHGNHIYFNAGQFAPESMAGRGLLAHELTHVVQQSHGLQRQSAGDAPSFAAQITEEIIDLSQDSTLTQLPDLSDLSEADAEETVAAIAAQSPDQVIQTRLSPTFLQRANGADANPRKDYVFLMGSSGGFFVAAKRFFKDHHAEAEIIALKDASLAGVFAKLRQIASDQQPIGNLYIVSHANVDGTLSFGLTKKDKDKKTSFGELKNALANSPDLFALQGGIDANTKIHIKGCNIGRNLDMLNALDEAFGGDVEVDAPTHKQGYEFHTKGRGRAAEVISSEFFNTYNVEFSGRVDKSADELIEAFKEKYTDLGFSEQDWEIAVLGVAKQGKKVDKATSTQKKEVDARLKAGLAALDKTASEFKAETKRLKEEAKAEKSEITRQASESKKTVVAKKSKGASRRLVTPFTATLFADKLPPLTEAEILKKAPLWFAKERKKGWLFTSASLAREQGAELETFTYTINGERRDERIEFTYTIEMPIFPETDDDAITLANGQLEKYTEKHPTFAIARSEMFDWRITREKKKGAEIIKAFLEMTIYTIDLDLRSSEGAIIDPATKEGEEFFFGESNVD